MSDLFELRTSIHQRRLEQENKPVVMYRENLGDIVPRLEQELKDLARIGTKVMPFVFKVLQNADYAALRPDDPPSLKRAIQDLRNCCDGATQTFKNYPGKIEALLGRIKGTTRETFSQGLCGPQKLASEDRREAVTLLDRARP